MSDLDHKPGVREANLVSCRLKLEQLHAEAVESLLAELGQLYGMDQVKYDTESSVLLFAYDATHCSLDAVERTMTQQGAQFSSSWWNRAKRGYYRFVDQNMKDNATHEPHCCNKVPRKK